MAKNPDPLLPITSDAGVTRTLDETRRAAEEKHAALSAEKTELAGRLAETERFLDEAKRVAADEHAALTAACLALLNLDAAITRD